MLSDIELLEIELRTIWAVDAGGRLIARERQAGVPYAVIATARSGWRIAYGAAVPEHVARELAPSSAPGRTPAIPPRRRRTSSVAGSCSRHRWATSSSHPVRATAYRPA